jgi:hypothetical protein
MMTASVTTSPDLVLGRVIKLFDRSEPTPARSPAPYDVSPVDGRFLFMKTIEQQAGGPVLVTVFTNWLAELTALAPTR